MRYLMAVCLVAGCYKPSTDSCYYACATQGTPCPSGLSCVAGMCAAPGDDCSAVGIDSGGGDSGPPIDVAGAACGDGTATVGEVCFGTPIGFMLPGNPTAAHLADRDGDSDVDLIYMDNSGYRFHLNTGGVLAMAPISGPPVTDATAMLTANFNGAPGVELINTSQLELYGYMESGGGTYTQLFVRPIGVFGAAGFSLAFGRISATGIGDIAVANGTQLVVYRLDSPMTLTQLPARQIPRALDLAVGRLNADTFEDVVLASDTGVHTFFSDGLSLANPLAVGPGVRIDNVEIGDFDDDNQSDIAFTSSSPTTGMGTLGIMRGRGNGLFEAPVVQTVVNLGAALAVVDIDRDGRDDVIAFQGGATPAVLIARGKTDASLEAPIKLAFTGGAFQLSSRGDFNGDMVPDIVVTDTAGRRVVVIPSMP